MLLVTFDSEHTSKLKIFFLNQGIVDVVLIKV